MNTRDRLLSKVAQTETCWLWTGAKQKNGYGAIKYQGKVWSPHRLMYLLEHGSVPAGMDICHSCDVRLCCRPDHLFAGTRADNMLDCVSKGRHPQANPAWVAQKIVASDPRRTIKIADVERVREMILAGATQKQIAAEFGTTDRTVRHFCRRFEIPTKGA